MASQVPFSGGITMTDSQFRKAYGDYCSMQGQRMKLKLPVRNQMADLVLLWRLVSSVGGSQAVSQHAVWPEIAEGLLKVPPSNAVAADAVRNLYQERLGGFEAHMRRGAQPDQFQRVLRSEGEPRGASASPEPEASREQAGKAARSGSVTEPPAASKKAPASPGKREPVAQPPAKSLKTESDSSLAKAPSTGQQRPTSKAHRLLSQRMASNKDSSTSGRPTEGRTAPSPQPAPKRATVRSPAKRRKPSQDTKGLASQSSGSSDRGLGQRTSSQLEPLPYVPEWALKADIPHFLPAPRPAAPTRDPRTTAQLAGQAGIPPTATRDPRLGPDPSAQAFAPVRRDPRPTAQPPASEQLAGSSQSPAGMQALQQQTALPADPFSTLPLAIAAKISAAMNIQFGGGAPAASTQGAPAVRQLPQSQPGSAAPAPAQASAAHLTAASVFQPMPAVSGPAGRDPRSASARPEPPRPAPIIVKALQGPPVFRPQARQPAAAHGKKVPPPNGVPPVFIPQPKPFRRRTPPPVHSAAGKAASAAKLPRGAEKAKGGKHVSLNALMSRTDVDDYPTADFDRGAVSRGGVYASLGGANGPSGQQVHQGIAYVPPNVHSVQPAVKVSSRRDRSSKSRSHLKQLQTVNLKEALSLVRNGARTFAFPAVLDPADPDPPPLGDAPLQQRAVQPISLEALKALHALNPLIASKELDHHSVPTAQPSNKRPREDPLALPPHYRDLLLRFRSAKWAEGDQRPGKGDAPPREGGFGKRRSSRVRHAPAAYVPSFGGDRRSTSPDSDEEEAETDLMIGPSFQAELPACRPKPPHGGQPPAEEAVWLQDLVCRPGMTMGAPNTRTPVITSAAEPSLERRYAVGNRLLMLAEVASFGLDKMGTADARDWTPTEVAAFGSGLAKHGRDFARIATEFLPFKGPHRVVGFYYNIWKARAIPEAREWYRRRDLEKEAAERERVALEVRRAEANTFSQMRRQLKEAVAWVRQVARTPRAPHTSKVRGERMARATKAMARTYVRRKQAEMRIAEVQQ